MITRIKVGIALYITVYIAFPVLYALTKRIEAIAPTVVGHITCRLGMLPPALPEAERKGLCLEA